MINTYKTISYVVLLFFLLFFASCEKQQTAETEQKNQSKAFSPIYFTVEEYNRERSEQKDLFESFNQIVQAETVRIKSGLQSKPVSIAFIYPGAQVSDYWRRSMSSFKHRMDEIGIDYVIKEFFTRAGTVDSNKQAEQLRTALDQDPDYLVFTLNVMNHRNLIERILTKGRPKLILQNITTPLRAWEGKQPFLYVGFDHVIGSQILARYFIQRTGGVGEYAVLFFSEGYVSDMRGNTFIDYITHHSDLRLVSAHYTEGQREQAKTIALSVLEDSPQLKFFYACSTDVALGALDALKATGRINQVAFNGWGGGSSELESIVAGEMDVTVMRMNDDNGVAMAEAIRLDLENRSDQVPLVYSGEFSLVEKGIETSKLKGLQVRAFRYSNR